MSAYTSVPMYASGMSRVELGLICVGGALVLACLPLIAWSIVLARPGREASCAGCGVLLGFRATPGVPACCGRGFDLVAGRFVCPSVTQQADKASMSRGAS